MSDAILMAAAARLAAAFPDWNDATGNAHPTPASSLPAFALRLTYSDSERVGMGDHRFIHEGQLEIGIEINTPPDSETGLHDLARQINQVLLADPPDLNGTAWSIEKGSFEADHEKAETPISRGELLMPIQVLE
ncbi:hypothetical protein GFB49_11670 [Epibacterium sp. SM1979]|uniref:Uncharacterized protein n=1 Tax=Tritonibacter litoralis TaxID=2662264 RepID=A0A843YHG7_9RHOB|nr:hypothetical protein [Tritonibacter litoralis]MQQ09115.1 hypothetical protein [Tritonibacter litoralis]